MFKKLKQNNAYKKSNIQEFNHKVVLVHSITNVGNMWEWNPINRSKISNFGVK
jgi:hypothetical protein